jgi:hypothetical protein
LCKLLEADSGSSLSPDFLSEYAELSSENRDLIAGERGLVFLPLMQ